MLLQTVDPVLGALDPNQSLIMYRLYRDSTTYRAGKYIKVSLPDMVAAAALSGQVCVLSSNTGQDLTRLNRDLNRVVMIDDTEEHTIDQPGVSTTFDAIIM